jgi:hypothetical protein
MHFSTLHHLDVTLAFIGAERKGEAALLRPGLQVGDPTRIDGILVHRYDLARDPSVEIFVLTGLHVPEAGENNSGFEDCMWHGKFLSKGVEFRSGNNTIVTA